MRINQKTNIEKNLASHPDATTNFEGAQAFTLSPEAELYQRVASCLFGEPKYYSNRVDETKEVKGIVNAGHQRIVELIKQISKKDPEFILQMAYYCRNELYLRTISIVMLVEAANIVECKPFVRVWTPYIINRADEITEAIAYQYSRFGRKPNLPKSLQRGIGDSFRKFDEYQFAKYNRKANVKLKDAVKLCHPVPSDEKRSDLYKRIIEDALKTPETWEVKISTKGSTTQNWEQIMPKMGYMAKLRNLRNFLEKGCDVTGVLSDLKNKEQVLRSRQFPFRFLSAYKELTSVTSPMTGATLNTLNEAIEHSISNIPKLKGVTALTADQSGSMDMPISDRSKLHNYEIGNTLMAMANQFCEYPITSVFGEKHVVLQIPKGNIITSADAIYKEAQGRYNVGHSTNGFLIFKYLLEQKVNVDRVMIFTDEEMWDSCGWGCSETVAKWYKMYKSTINPKTKLYIFNLAGYGTTQIPEDEPNVIRINGWSDKVFKFIELFEKDKTQAIDEIKRIKIENDKRKIQK